MADAPPQDDGLQGVRRRKPARTVRPPKPTELARPARASEYEIMERRQQVARLRLRGMSIAEIAKELGINVFAARRDLEAVQKRNQGEVDKFQQSQFVGESLLVFDDIIQRAWAEYKDHRSNTKSRIDALNLIRTTQNDKLKALQDCGLIVKAPQQVEVRHRVELPWTPEIKEAAVHALLSTRLQPQLAEPTPDPDHMPGKNIIDAVVVEPAKAAASDK